tara:strand:+ start:920 stop:1912 length:993 start_codon:yes stop_codon:yes gene_type:complete
MSKLIYLIHPFELPSVKNLNDFLIVLKNILRLSASKGLTIKKDGILIPIRWSSKYNNWVADRGTDLYRDIDGITLENVDYYFNGQKNNAINKAIKFTLRNINANEELSNLFKKFNLVKNENKFIAFEYCCNLTNKIDNKGEYLYTIGLYQRCQTKKRTGIYSKNKKSIVIDNSKKFLESISNTSSIFLLNEKLYVKDYYSLYEKFYNKIKNKKHYFETLDKEIDFSKDVSFVENLNFSYKQKNIINIINDKTENKKDFNFYKSIVAMYLIYFDFVNEIKNHLDISEQIEGFVADDTINNINYKLTGDFMLENSIINKEKVLQSPIMPLVF